MSKSREIILEFVKVARRREKINIIIKDLSFATCVGLFFIILTDVFGLLISEQVETQIILVGFSGLVILYFYFLLRLFKPIQMGRIAGIIDFAGDLKDEIKTALWLISNDKKSEISLLALKRAAITTQKIEIKTLLPLRISKFIPMAFVLGFVCVLPNKFIEIDASSLRVSSNQTGNVAKSLDNLRSSLGDTSKDLLLSNLDQALADLNKERLTKTERRAIASEVRDAVDEVNMRASLTRDGLERLADLLEDNIHYKDVAKAIRSGDLKEASDLLAMTDENLEQKGDASDKSSSNPKSGDMNAVTAQEFLGEIDDMTEELSGINARLNEERLKEVLESIDDAEEMLDAQERVRSVNSQAQDLLIAQQQSDQLTPSRFDNPADAPPDSVDPTGAPEDGNTSMRGGSLFRQASLGQGEDSTDGSEFGSSAGDSEADSLEGEAMQRLEATLRLERIQLSKSDGDNEIDGEKTSFYSPTERGDVLSNLVDVRENKIQSKLDVIQLEKINIQQRRLVKEYFTNIHKEEIDD